MDEAVALAVGLRVWVAVAVAVALVVGVKVAVWVRVLVGVRAGWPPPPILDDMQFRYSRKT